MGAQVWKRTEAGGTSYTIGVQPQPTFTSSASAGDPRLQQNHRQQAVGNNPRGTAEPPAKRQKVVHVGNLASGAKVQGGAQHPRAPANGHVALQSKELQIERIRRELQHKQQLLEKQQDYLKAREASKQHQQQQQLRVQQRKAQLDKGFGVATSQHAAEASSTARPSIEVADKTEIARVLNSKHDYEVLKLHVGASLAQVRSSYRQMAIALHPDKCHLEGAKAAFQKLTTAYQNLTK